MSLECTLLACTSPESKRRIDASLVPSLCSVDTLAFSDLAESNPVLHISSSKLYLLLDLPASSTKRA